MDDPLQILPYAAPSVVVILTFPSVWRSVRNIRRVKTSDVGGIYEDQDGIATKESMNNFSARRQISVISLAVALGLAASFVFAVFATASPSSTFNGVTHLWVLFWSWVCGGFLPN
jgi:hypothetical protein